MRTPWIIYSASALETFWKPNRTTLDLVYACTYIQIGSSKLGSSKLKAREHPHGYDNMKNNTPLWQLVLAWFVLVCVYLCVRVLVRGDVQVPSSGNNPWSIFSEFGRACTIDRN